MIRNLILKKKFDINRYNEQSWSLNIEITKKDLIPLFLELQLLYFSKINILEIRQNSYIKSLLIKKGTEFRSVIDLKEECVYLSFSENDLEIIFSYLLEYYLQGVATVNHIDIEINSISNLGKDCTLIIVANDFLEPMNAEEARKSLLGE